VAEILVIDVPWRLGTDRPERLIHLGLSLPEPGFLKAGLAAARLRWIESQSGRMGQKANNHLW